MVVYIVSSSLASTEDFKIPKTDPNPEILSGATEPQRAITIGPHELPTP